MAPVVGTIVLYSLHSQLRMYEIKNIRLEFHFFFRILVGYTLDEIILKIAPTPSQARHHQPWVSNSTAVFVA